MRARLIVPAVLGAFVLSTAAFAAGTTTTPPAKDQKKVQTAAVKAEARCTALEGQFDDAITTRGTMAKAKSAQMLRTQGGALCGQGKHEAGIVKLQRALKDIGVKPTM